MILKSKHTHTQETIVHRGRQFRAVKLSKYNKEKKSLPPSSFFQEIDTKIWVPNLCPLFNLLISRKLFW